MQYFTLFCICFVIYVYDSSARDIDKSKDSSTRDVEKFRQEVLAQHNIFRKEQCAGPLKRNATLDEIAQKWCHKLAETGQFVHSNTTEYGENSFQKIPFDSAKDNGATPVNVWYNERVNYTVTAPHATLHYTQIVWKNTDTIGVGVCYIANNGIIVVVNYSPRGNYENQFAKNVGC